MTTMRLWNAEFDHLATQSGCRAPKRLSPECVEAAVRPGPLLDAIHSELRADRNMYISWDPDPDEPPAARVSAIVTSLSIEQRPCECGNSTVTTATVRGHVPLGTLR
ncbi:hypothetical protein LV457_02775 [Mycobacterium sp. MYCO198283]|uniref:hypothetical protein n=1 Tax=Mycobacterium sp. MYCO198283 TaxID=2883505 RepID=UPI001E3000D6|nr:hypothetical protein [Mycobacterium sp. MYCO198283]MCG5431213.1 hypothetical protein [Mycobacterium sp. MYCO198283]